MHAQDLMLHELMITFLDWKKPVRDTLKEAVLQRNSLHVDFSFITTLGFFVLRREITWRRRGHLGEKSRGFLGISILFNGLLVPGNFIGMLRPRRCLAENLKLILIDIFT